METEDVVVLLAAAPATAYREYLYRPRGPFARWIDDRFEVLATPGRCASQPVREGDLLLDVTLGRPGGGRCITLTIGEPDLDLDRYRLPPGRLLLRPRKPAQMS